MVRSSGGSLVKGKTTGEHGVVVVILEMGDSNDGRAEDRVDESNTSDISMSESRDIVLFWTSALWLGVSLLWYCTPDPAPRRKTVFGEWRRVRAFAGKTTH
jgi:hypothetical protein